VKFGKLLDVKLSTTQRHLQVADSLFSAWKVHSPESSAGWTPNQAIDQPALRSHRSPVRLTRVEDGLLLAVSVRVRTFYPLLHLYTSTPGFYQPSQPLYIHS